MLKLDDPPAWRQHRGSPCARTIWRGKERKGKERKGKERKRKRKGKGKERNLIVQLIKGLGFRIIANFIVYSITLRIRNLFVPPKLYKKI